MYRRTRAQPTPIEEFCNICQEKYSCHFNGSYSDRCLKCQNKNRICRWCDSLFDARSDFEDECQECIQIRKMIHRNRNPTPEMFHPDFKIRVVYATKKIDHSGYCSDPYDFEIQYRRTVCVLPLILSFENPILGDVSLSNPIICRYYSLSERKECPCRRSEYLLIRATIVCGDEPISKVKRILSKKIVPSTENLSECEHDMLEIKDGYDGESTHSYSDY